jgi:hypothetical protein
MKGSTINGVVRLLNLQVMVVISTMIGVILHSQFFEFGLG